MELVRPGAHGKDTKAKRKWTLRWKKNGRARRMAVTLTNTLLVDVLSGYPHDYRDSY